MQSHQMKRAAGNSAPTDSNFKQTVLLLHGDGTNGAQNNTFIDGSTNNFTITRNGNTTQGTFSPFSQSNGYWSNYFDGTGDYISVADSADFTMGSGDFTVECWVYSTANSASDQYILGQVPSTGAAASTSFQIYKKATTNVAECYVYIGGAKVATSTATISINQWTHIAMVRDGATMRLYINGVQDGTNATLSTSSIVDSTGSFAVGRTGDYNGLYFSGYVSNVSVIKGTCLYPSGTSFTPSTTPLSTSRSNQSVLLCYANRFFDSNTATTAKTVTVGGDSAVTAFSPFAPAAAYSASTNGGSGYFDGTGDYLSVSSTTAFNMGSGDFTAECWVYLTNSSVASAFISTAETSDFQGFFLGISGGVFYFLADSTGSSPWDVSVSGGTVVSNTWTHVAGVRSGNTFTLYVNGQSIASSTQSVTLGNSNNLIVVGGRTNTSQYTFGYISNARVVKGTAVYTAAFTPPTAPLTAITNTSLLCNFTNAGIIDSTGKNDLETVGNAQISTSVVKYGTGSMYFDGTGDGLKIRSNQDLILGSGNWTIECWVYHASVTGQQTYVGDTPGNTSGPYFYKDTSHKVGLYYSSQILTGTTTLSATTWYHVAVARSSGTVKLFVNGTEEASASDTTNLSVSIQWVGADNTSNVMNGYIDDLRVTKGVARYTANFTVPARAFPDK